MSATNARPGALAVPANPGRAVAQAAAQRPSGQAQRVERGAREQAEAGAGLGLGWPAWLWAAGLPAGDSAPAPAPAAARSTGAAVVPAAARRLGVWAIHGQRRGPR